MLERENEFYMANQAEFMEKYNDKWLVIVGESLWKVFDKFSDAAKEALQNFEPGEFLIHRPADNGTIIEVSPFLFLETPDVEKDDIPEPVTIASKGELVEFQYAY